MNFKNWSGVAGTVLIVLIVFGSFVAGCREQEETKRETIELQTEQAKLDNELAKLENERTKLENKKVQLYMIREMNAHSEKMEKELK
ncbi:hypothetical protein [Paenibacillus xylanexedens]|uniref:hypothetical protein n=1 Tax=Paenibacillus xylanexedens TaxID=528191 RepID=UPI000F53F73B|nr:hypothetical protein [Paenibacillus xylanexedens]RPK19978.1 hypothetical protein EDO6_06495 [Paenibacillus xylanexedens]